jgi:glycosyltransferase involved in cell wall biosynthesis
VTVVVPTYQEADNIASLCRGVREALPDAQLMIVDDASPDGTAKLARELGDELGGIEVVERPAKSGIGSAYRDGFRRAIDSGADICVQMDADLSHDPDVLRALATNVELGADLAIGSRYVPGGRTVDWPRRRRSLSRWGNRYAAGVLGLAVNDATAGYRVYRADTLRAIGLEGVQAGGYGFQIEMTYRVVRAGLSVVEVPIEFRDRVAGASKMNQGIVVEAFKLVTFWGLADLVTLRRRHRAYRTEAAGRLNR